MKIKETLISSDPDDWDVRSGWKLKVSFDDPEQPDRNLSFSDGEPEDMNLGRDLNDAYGIAGLVMKAYEAGKRGEELIYESEDISWDEY